MATSGEVTSPEAEALKNAFDYLVKTIDTDSLIPAALSRKLISERQQEACSCESDRYKKAEKFISHILRAVNGDSNNFHVFIQVLFDCDQPSIARRIHAELVSAMRQPQQENVLGVTEVPVPDELIYELADLRIAFAMFLCEYEGELQKNDEAQRKFVKTLQILLDKSLDFSKCFKSLIEKEVTLFNITYMEKLCKVFPENVRATLIELVDTYKQKLHHFMAGTTVNEFKTLFPSPITSSALSAEKVSIKLKLKNFWGDKTLDDLLKLVITLLGIPGDYLHLSKVENGCVAVIWLCSNSLIIELIAKMHEVTKSLQTEGVQQVYVGEQLFLGPMEKMDHHQWDTAKLRDIGIRRRRVQHQKIKQAATSSSFDDEMVRTTSFPSHFPVFSDKLALIVGVAASFLLALVIYVSVGSFLKPPSFHFDRSEINLYLIKNPQVLVLSLYVFHQPIHYAMTYYAQTRLRCSNSLQPFHYWMVGMNFVFVMLYVVQCRLVPNNLLYRDAIDLNISTVFLFLLIVTAKRGLVFGYSIPYTQDVSKFIEKQFPYCFSFIILLNFWYKPFIENLFFMRIFLDLIFIMHSCLIQTRIHKSIYWTLFLELMVISYFLLKVNAASSAVDYSFDISIYIAVFVISLIHELPFFTRMLNFLIIIIALIALTGCLYFWNFRVDLSIVLTYFYFVYCLNIFLLFMFNILLDICLY